MLTTMLERLIKVGAEITAVNLFNIPRLALTNRKNDIFRLASDPQDSARVESRCED